MSALKQLAERWREEAQLLEKYGDVVGAKACALHATELEAAMTEAENEELTLEQAANESGYSERRLREMIASGQLPNAGKKGAPRLRRGELPRRPGKPVAAYDASADARALLGRAG